MSSSYIKRKAYYFEELEKENTIEVGKRFIKDCKPQSYREQVMFDITKEEIQQIEKLINKLHIQHPLYRAAELENYIKKVITESKNR